MTKLEEGYRSMSSSLFSACTAPDMETGVPFKAQAIIANPPAYGEWLGLKILVYHVFLY